jgi:hypothetical protein
MVESFHLSNMTNSGLIVVAPILRNTAYLDPGSGSYLLQILVASILGAAVVIRMSWGRIRAFFTRTQPEEMKDQDEETGEQ